MNQLANFHFIRPFVLLLVPCVVLLWLWLRRQNDPLRAWRSIVEPELLDAMTVQQPGALGTRDVGLLSLWVLAVLAIAGPTWQLQKSPFADDPAAVMLLLKAGDSMQLSDLAPSRMERARLKAIDFAEARAGLPLGLIAYAGSSHRVLPPTRDTEVVATMAAEIGPEIMPKKGDDLADALELAAKTIGKNPGSIVVVADSVATDVAARLASIRSSIAYSVHVLGVARADTPEADALKQAANALGAKLTLLTTDAQDVTTVVRQVARAPRSASVEGASARWAEFGWWLTPIIAVIVLAGFRREQLAPEVKQ